MLLSMQVCGLSLLKHIEKTYGGASSLVQVHLAYNDLSSRMRSLSAIMDVQPDDSSSQSGTDASRLSKWPDIAKSVADHLKKKPDDAQVRVSPARLSVAEDDKM